MGNIFVPAVLRVTHRFALHHGLALRQPVHRDPHSAGLQLEQFGARQHHKGQHVVAVAASDLAHHRVMLAVKIAVKAHGVAQRVGGRMLVVPRQVFKHGQRQNHLVRDIQAHHGQGPASSKHDVSCVGIVPDVGLGHRRYIARFQHRTTHQHHLAHQAG